MILKTLYIFLLWFVIGLIGLVISFNNSLLIGAGVVAFLYLIWCLAERRIEKWLK